MQIQILPSLLAADFGHLADDILRAEASGADALHLDIMDAHFVPNLSFGPDVVALSRKVAPGFYRHVHLMMLVMIPLAAVFVLTGRADTKSRLQVPPRFLVPACLLIGLVIGFYDGLVGPGTGTFLHIPRTRDIGPSAFPAPGRSPLPAG